MDFEGTTRSLGSRSKLDDFAFEYDRSSGKKPKISVYNFDRFNEFSGSIVYVVLRRKRLSITLECGSIDMLREQGFIDSNDWNAICTSHYFESEAPVVILVQFLSLEGEKLYQWSHSLTRRKGGTRTPRKGKNGVKSDNYAFVTHDIDESGVNSVLKFIENREEPQLDVLWSSSYNFEEHIEDKDSEPLFQQYVFTELLDRILFRFLLNRQFDILPGTPSPENIDVYEAFQIYLDLIDKNWRADFEDRDLSEITLKEILTWRNDLIVENYNYLPKFRGEELDD